MVTIYDVAAACGFSPATVSKALNSYAGVNKATYEKIMRTAKEMGYMPNSAAKALITKKSWLVGMLFSEELATCIKHPHFSEIFSNAHIQLGKAGYDVIFINNSVGGSEISYLEHSLYRGVDGIIMAASAQFSESVRCITESSLKMVSVEMTYPNRYSVISKNYNGAMQAMDYLFSLGHRNIACITGPLNSLAAPERYQAYRDFLASKEIPFRPELVVEAADYTAQAGYDAAIQLLNQAKGKFTAVFLGYDDLAYAAIKYFRSQGLRVPDDISVIGFDDLEPSEMAGITTIRQDRAKIGCLAADVLIAQMQDQPLDYPYDIRVPTSLVVRSSCRRIN